MSMPVAPRDSQRRGDARPPAQRPAPEQWDPLVAPAAARHEEPPTETRLGSAPPVAAMPPVIPGPVRPRVEPVPISSASGPATADRRAPQPEQGRQIPRQQGPGLQGPGTQGPGTQGPGTQGPGTQGPGTQGPGTQGPGTQGPGTQGPGTQGPGTQGPGQTGPDQQRPDQQRPGTPDLGRQPAAAGHGMPSAGGQDQSGPGGTGEDGRDPGVRDGGRDLAAAEPAASRPVSPAAASVQGADGSAIQLTPPAAGDHRPSVQTITDLPLMPIGRIATSGPDTAPKTYSDQGLDANWFTAKPSEQPSGEASPAEPELAEEQAGAPGQEVTDTGTRLSIDLDLSGLLGGAPVTGPSAAADPVPALPTRKSKKPADTTTEQDQTPGPDESQAQEQGEGGAKGLIGPALPPEGTAAGRAGAAGLEWAARDDTRQFPLILSPEPKEPRSPVRPLKPLGPDDLAAIRWRLDGGTLREVVDDRDALRDLGGRLDEPLSHDADDVTRAGLLSVRAEVYRLLDELGMAASASRMALTHARSAGDIQATVIAQAELAHVLRLRGDFGEADRLFEEAASSEAPEQLRSIVHENAARSCFDQGRHMEALDHFARAVRLGHPEDTDLAERIDVSLEAVYIHALRDGWGPYPRLRREILGARKD
jgi:hypothetical protein